MLESIRRSVFKITERGKNLLIQNPKQINIDLLRQFPEFIEFITPNIEVEEIEPEQRIDNLQITPEETLENSYQNIRRTLAQELLLKIKQIHQHFLNNLLLNY